MKRSLNSVNQFNEKHPAFSVGGLRWQIFNADANGMTEAGVILRVGRRVLIDEDRYFAWLDSQNGIGPQVRS